MKTVLDVEDIQTLLPHRFPMLLVDRIVELRPGEHVVGLKNVTINEPFFTGHFPGQAVMPGVLILEAMAQVGGVMMLALPEHQGKLAYIAKIGEFRFRRPVVPGDTLLVEAKILSVRGTIGKVGLQARVGDEIVTEGELTFALKDPAPKDQVYAKLQQIARCREESQGE
jgi:3-hydroxyacyl-[acyl-carrier-protein] dehydratase